MDKNVAMSLVQIACNNQMKESDRITKVEIIKIKEKECLERFEMTEKHLQKENHQSIANFNQSKTFYIKVHMSEASGNNVTKLTTEEHKRNLKHTPDLEIGKKISSTNEEVKVKAPDNVLNKLTTSSLKKIFGDIMISKLKFNPNRFELYNDNKEFIVFTDDLINEESKAIGHNASTGLDEFINNGTCWLKMISDQQYPRREDTHKERVVMLNGQNIVTSHLTICNRLKSVPIKPERQDNPGGTCNSKKVNLQPSSQQQHKRILNEKSDNTSKKRKTAHLPIEEVAPMQMMDVTIQTKQIANDALSISEKKKILQTMDATLPTLILGTPLPILEGAPPAITEEVSLPVAEEAPLPIMEEAPPSIADKAHLPIVEEAPPSIAEEAPSSIAEETPPSIAEEVPPSIAEKSSLPIAEETALPLPIAIEAPSSMTNINSTPVTEETSRQKMEVITTPPIMESTLTTMELIPSPTMIASPPHLKKDIIEANTPPMTDEILPVIIKDIPSQIMEFDTPPMVERTLLQIIDETSPSIMEAIPSRLTEINTPPMMEALLSPIVDEALPSMIEATPAKINEVTTPPMMEETSPSMMLAVPSPEETTRLSDS